MNKWNNRAQVGIYLGRSPRHARNVALILNVHTGLVSPQFHVKFDKRFKTVNQLPDLQPQWVYQVGLATPEKKLQKQAKRDATHAGIKHAPTELKCKEATPTQPMKGGLQGRPNMGLIKPCHATTTGLQGRPKGSLTKPCQILNSGLQGRPIMGSTKPRHSGLQGRPNMGLTKPRHMLPTRSESPKGQALISDITERLDESSTK